MTRATLATTRSGRPRADVSPAAVARELEAHESRLRAVEHALAPAFAPSPRRDRVSRGPGDHPAEPYRMGQASTNTDPWAGDVEHSPGYVDDIAYGVPVSELRERSAQDAMMRAVTSEPDPVLYAAAVWCGRNGCRPATPCGSCAGKVVAVADSSRASVPVQRSVVYGEWRDYPDHGQEPPGSGHPRPVPGLSLAGGTTACLSSSGRGVWPPRCPATAAQSCRDCEEVPCSGCTLQTRSPTRAWPVRSTASCRSTAAWWSPRPRRGTPTAAAPAPPGIARAPGPRTRGS
jgi:hypothetical protein